MENGHRNSGFSHKKTLIFYSYVSHYQRVCSKKMFQYLGTYEFEQNMGSLSLKNRDLKYEENWILSSIGM